MFIRNGIRSNLRARGRTALFSCLILFLTLVMILALGVRLYCAGALEECERLYRSIAVVEYMGAEYPDESEPDDFARAAAAVIDDEAVSAVDGVRYWGRDDRSLSYVEGYTRSGNDMPYRNRGVLVVWDLSPVYKKIYRPVGSEDPDFDVSGEEPYEYEEITTDDVDYYTGLLSRSLYSYDGKQEVFVNVVPEGRAFQPEPRKAYVIHGSFLEARVGGPLNGMRSFTLHGFDESDAVPWEEYGGSESISAVFTEAAERYRIINNYVETVTAPDLEDLRVFQQGTLYLEEGRMPEPGEEDACVVSGDMAQSMGLVPGDTIRATAFSSREDNRYDMTLTDRHETLRVVGVTNTLDEYQGYLWRRGPYREETALYGYTLGTMSLENGKAAEAAEAVAALMPDNVRVTLLDQGYTDAVEPFRSMESTASNVLLACGAGVVAVLLLFAFLFVGRQNETVQTLVALGTPRRGIVLWLLSGAVLIAGLSALAGGALGGASLPLVFRLIRTLAERMRGERLMFSEMLLGSIKEPELQVSVPPWPILRLILGIIAVAVLFCLLFLRTAYRGGTLRRGKSRVRVPKGKTSLAGRGSLRFALLSIRRGGLRSLVVPVVSAALAVLMIVLCGIYQGWQNDLRAAVESASLGGQVTSTDGELFSGLTVQLSTVQQLLQLDDVESVYVSQRWHYWLTSEMPSFGGGAFGQEHRADWIARQPEIVAVNSLKGAKEFYFTDPSVTWLDGWDESCMAGKDEAFGTVDIEGIPGVIPEGISGEIPFTITVFPAVVSDRFLEDHGWELGTNFGCEFQNEYWNDWINLQVVGVYKQTGNRAHIYVPLSFYIDPDIITGERVIAEPEGLRLSWTAEDYENARLLASTFSTCRFTLESASHLDNTRRTLAEAGFGWPGHMGAARTTVILRDASLVKLTENLGRYMAMGRVMLGMILLIVALLGFIISWLMVNGRKGEFAIMRGFGARKERVFLSFFLEQAALCLCGCLIGCLSLIWLGSGGAIQWIALAAYLLCYLAGCAVSVKKIGKMNLMELLATRE